MASNARTLVSLQGLADPRCHYQISRTLQMGRPGHDRYLPIPCSPLLSHRKCSDVQGDIRGREGGQAICFEEGCIIDVEVEFTHSKVIGSDHSGTFPRPCSFAELLNDADGAHPKRTR